ncbi:sensor histidine kinase [Paenibacillus sacheonensis]|uniref:HAMP domain-containing protein n=1 Tax=Paenibacillus sacheonensis TaxID=742054 RepID=A0A7X4YV07_9BACL|nr:histidine kinase [Paenibacillus sacheonensis]MBM7568428.1 two-component system sensor histidine kinase YesM [Paenibacillus sacheonensis]NBC72126.1 HAMP domain-containing protein [Paenibacillus sacheonensis]
MSILKRLASLSILPKLVLTFLITLTPLYIIGWRMNEVGSRHVQKEITDSLVSRTSLYMNMLEFDLDSVIRQLQEYVNDDDLLKLSSASEFMTEIEKMQAQLRLKNRLNQLKSSSKFVENAIAFIPQMNRVVSANDNVIGSFDPEEFEGLNKSTNRFEAPFLVWNNRVFISLPNPDPAVAGDQEPVFLLAVEISRSELERALQEFTNEGGRTALVGGEQPFIVTGGATAVDQELVRDFKKAGEHAAEDQLQAVDWKGESYLLVSNHSNRLDMTLLMYVPENKVNASLEVYRFWFYVLSVVSVILVILFSYSIYLIIHMPLKRLVRSFRRIEQGQFDQEMHYPLQDEFGYLYGQFNGMVRRLDVLVHEVYEQQYRARLAELRHLQSQINPHFLYNSYFILYRMAKQRDHDNVIYFTKHLGEYFQYITRDGSDEVPLSSEVHHARTYAEIQSIRFSERIEVAFEDVPENVRDFPVPRLIVQPIIENAYNHGLENKRRGGLISVGFRIRQSAIDIVIEDNGDDMSADKLRLLQASLQDKAEPTEHTGLLNVHRRIIIRYGGGGLKLDLGAEQGLKVTITIPREGGGADVSLIDR